MRLLVSGAASGLGRYLARRLGATPLVRGTPIAELEHGSAFDAIIHCAAAAYRNVTNRSLYRYLADNLLLTRDLCAIPHRRFIYMSSIAVYPSDATDTTPDAVIPCDQPHDLYRLMKLGGEAITLANATRPLVLRISGMLGEDARPNTVSRILGEDDLRVSLAAESSFNYVLHQDIGDFVERSFEFDLAGTFNVAASANVELREIADTFGKSVSWGNFVYRTPPIDIEASARILPTLRRSTVENVLRYDAALRGNRAERGSR